MTLFVAGALAVTGCATGYGAQGLTGGYSDSRIDDTHHVVKFNGNGFASIDTGGSVEIGVQG